MTLDQKVGDKMNENRSLVEKIALYVPIYRGYKQKNLRRDEDRAVRQEVAKVLETAKTDLASIQRACVGSVEVMRDAERIRAKADKYYIDVKKAAGGYSSFHDSVKILESELDSLIRWDAKLIDDAVLLKAQTAAAAEASEEEGTEMKPLLKKLEKTIDRLAEEYTGRETVMKGFKE